MNDEATKKLINDKAAAVSARIRKLAAEAHEHNDRLMEQYVEMARNGETLPALPADIAIEVFERASLPVPGKF